MEDIQKLSVGTKIIVDELHPCDGWRVYYNDMIVGKKLEIIKDIYGIGANRVKFSNPSDNLNITSDMFLLTPAKYRIFK